MITGIQHFAIISSSEKSVEFYSKLGFCAVFRKERKNDTIVILEGNGIQIEMFIDDDHPARATLPENIGLRHLAFAVDDIEKIEEEFDCGPIMTNWFGKKYRFTADPDGLPIEFTE